MELSRRGCPSVEVVTSQFDELASTIIRANKLPESTKVVVPKNPEYVGKDELIMLADRALDDIVSKLTQPTRAD